MREGFLLRIDRFSIDRGRCEQRELRASHSEGTEPRSSTDVPWATAALIWPRNVATDWLEVMTNKMRMGDCQLGDEFHFGHSDYLILYCPPDSLAGCPRFRMRMPLLVAA